MTPNQRARAAYARYGAVTEFKNYQGNPMPEFDALSETIQKAWEAAATDPIFSDWRNQLDSRQLKEIDFALEYERTFSHGTDGHNRLLLIAALAHLLDGQS